LHTSAEESDDAIERRIAADPGWARAALQQTAANDKVQQAYRDVTSRAREVRVEEWCACG